MLSVLTNYEGCIMEKSLLEQLIDKVEWKPTHRDIYGFKIQAIGKIPLFENEDIIIVRYQNGFLQSLTETKFEKEYTRPVTREEFLKAFKKDKG